MANRHPDFVGLDIGSSKITVLAADIENNKAKVIFHSIQSSSGIKDGMIIDQRLAEQAIMNAIYNLEEELNYNIKQVYLSVPWKASKSSYLYGEIKIKNPEIKKQDINNAIEEALSKFNEPDREIIHYSPIEFVAGNNQYVTDPQGMVSSSLGCNLNVISADSNSLLNTANFLGKYQIEILGFTPALYATSLVCLSQDDRHLGCLIIDIGSYSTNYAVFFSGRIIYSSRIPVGGYHITSDIAKAFSLPLSLAEKVKIIYGYSSKTPMGKNDVIKLEELLEGNESFEDYEIPQITAYNLAEIIYPRVEEILELVKIDYEKLKLNNLISRKVILTGGASKLKGIKETARKTFNMHARLAEPKLPEGFYSEVDPNMYGVVLGMLEDQMLKQTKEYTSSSAGKMSIFRQLATWIKENI